MAGTFKCWSFCVFRKDAVLDQDRIKAETEYCVFRLCKAVSSKLYIKGYLVMKEAAHDYTVKGLLGPASRVNWGGDGTNVTPMENMMYIRDMPTDMIEGPLFEWGICPIGAVDPPRPEAHGIKRKVCNDQLIQSLSNQHAGARAQRGSRNSQQGWQVSHQNVPRGKGSILLQYSSLQTCRKPLTKPSERKPSMLHESFECSKT